MPSSIGVQQSDWSNIELEPTRSKHNQSRSSDNKNYDDDRICNSYFKISCCSKVLLQSALVGVLLGAIPLAVIIVLWTSSPPKIYATETVTTVTTATTTSATTTTTTSTTSITTTTTSTTSTSTTTTTTTSVTTTSTTTSKTTTTTTTTSTSTTTTTTTTAFSSCNGFQWNHSAISVAGQSRTSGSTASKLFRPLCLEIDAQNAMYICDSDNYRVQKWQLNATNGTTVAETSTSDRLVDLAISPNKTLYVSYENDNYAARFTNQPTSGTVIAGVRGNAGSSTIYLNSPNGIAIDDNYNVYIADLGNQRVMKWTAGSSSGTVVIPSSSGTRFNDILLVPGTTDQFYLSSEIQDEVYLWQAGLTTPTIIFRQVNSSSNNLNSPRGIKLDPYGNLYVADRGNKRIVKFCPPSTMGFVVIDGNQVSSSFSAVFDLAFDSDMNLYIADRDNHHILKFAVY